MADAGSGAGDGLGELDLGLEVGVRGAGDLPVGRDSRPPRVIRGDRHQVALHMVSADDLVGPEHVVREVWDYVAAQDFPELYDAIGARSGGRGAPAHDPRVLLCLWIYATLEGISSARRIARLTEDSAPYRWITGLKPVNYHTLSGFRSHCGEHLEQLLVVSLVVMGEAGVIDPESLTVSHDGMRVRANAGQSSMRSKQAIEQRLVQAERHLEQIRRESSTEEQAEARREISARQQAARERAAREKVQISNRALQVLTERVAQQKKNTRQKNSGTKPRASTTDPDATVIQMANKGYNIGYNVQLTTEIQTRLITSVHVVAGRGDNGTLHKGMLNHARIHGGVLPTAVLTDQGFHSYDDIAALEAARCKVYLPDPLSGKPLPKHSRARRRSMLDLIESWRQRMSTPSAQTLYAMRPSTVEFANACCRNMGLTQVRVRGLAKVTSVAILTAITHNLRRLLNLLPRGFWRERCAQAT